jgi:hypothetical protein
LNCNSKLAFLFLIISLAAGCAGPKYNGSVIEDVGSVEIVIINDIETRSGFQNAMVDWLFSHKYKFAIVPDGSEHDLDKLSLEYVGLWSWDFAIFLADARITAYHKGQKVGEVTYKASNNFNANKFGDGAKRVKRMMDVLFGKITTDEVNNTANATKVKNSQDDDCDPGVEFCE